MQEFTKSVYERAAADEFKCKLPYATRRKDPEVNAAYNAEVRRLEGEFRKACEAEFGDAAWPQSVRDKVYAQAWESGHSAGYSEVANYYGTYTELAQVAFDAGREVERAKVAPLPPAPVEAVPATPKPKRIVGRKLYEG